MARGSAQNAKGNKANNQPASAKGAGSHLRANKGHESEFDDFEPLVEPSANRDIAGVVIAVLAIASFIAVISPATAPVTAAVAGFYHLGFGLGAYVLQMCIRDSARLDDTCGLTAPCLLDVAIIGVDDSGLVHARREVHGSLED